ncbi:MAG: hypothetical protein QXG39_09705 [Candidatus Aenigmatarchaeota archaeon]
MAKNQKKELQKIEDKIRDIINNIEVLVDDEKLDQESASDLIAQLKELAMLVGIVGLE